MASIGFIGLGMMGHGMVRRLLAAGHEVTVWNRTRGKSEQLEKEGARLAPALRDVVSGNHILFSMISSSDVLADIAAEVRSYAPRNAIHVDMSTVSPRTTGQCETAAQESGVRFIHAPVLGSVPQVNDGTLLIFAGGDTEAIETVRPLLSALGKKIYRFPGAAQASHLKLACNFFIASMIMTLGQGLSFASAAGIEGSTLLDVLSGSALAAPMYDTKGKNILDGNFTPRFFLDHMLKDVNLFCDAARGLGLHPPFADVLADAFSAAAEKGLGHEDYSSVVKVL